MGEIQMNNIPKLHDNKMKEKHNKPNERTYVFNNHTQKGCDKTPTNMQQSKMHKNPSNDYCQQFSNQFKPIQTKSNQIKPNQTKSNQVKPQDKMKLQT